MQTFQLIQLLITIIMSVIELQGNWIAAEKSEEMR